MPEHRLIFSGILAGRTPAVGLGRLPPRGTGGSPKTGKAVDMSGEALGLWPGRLSRDPT